ncbi:MAG: alpha/beta hydrolase [Hyphomicrobiaceae bacterium]|nr:alpha/beta hydrolase [Hyphomicrobiaceae bacterium]
MKPPSNGGTRGIGANRDPGATTGQPARPTATPRPPAVGQTPDENAAGSARDRTAVEEVAPRAPETTPPGPAKPQSAERLERAQPPSAAPDAASRDLAPGASSPGAVAADQQEDWTVVPVFFGTDRERAANDKRLDFGTARGRKLELGRALVSVPKAHEVPLIERPWSITIPYFKVKIYEQQEDPKKHFIMQELKTLSEAELLALVKDQLAKSARFKDHAFVFVHGYNTSFDFAVYRAAQISYDIKFDGASFVYSWPSGGGIASYTYDRESAAQAEPFFADFLKLVTQKSGAKSISVIAHSMGNQLLLRVLQDMHRQKPEGVQISQIILAAPDVDRDSFENIAASLKGMPSGGITLYAAANDRALDVSRRFHGGIPRAGDVPGGVPLVLPGIDTIDATAVSMDSLGLHHSGYAESNALLSDIGLLIQTGERPPGKRVPILQRVPTEKGEFWRYPAAR